MPKIPFVSALVRFFEPDVNHTDGRSILPKTLGEFMKVWRLENPMQKEYDIFEAGWICKRLENEHILYRCGTIGNSPLHSDAYYSIRYQEELASYQAYDYLVYGFPSIREDFASSIKPILVKHADAEGNQIEDIGTGFIVANNRLITAKHCVEEMSLIIVAGDDGHPAVLEAIYVSSRWSVDIAVLDFAGTPFDKSKKFEIGAGALLESVLTMGYPPIPGFEALLISETTTIGGVLKASSGIIVGADKAYLDGEDYYLMNARVKGGNSGGPVINSTGFVVGIVAQLPAESKQIDSLGYGIVIPSQRLTELLAEIQARGNYQKIAFKNEGKGFRTSLR